MDQEGYIEELSTYFYLDTTLLKSSKSVLSETYIFNVQYENDWYTLQKLTKPVFAFRQWENLVSSSIYPSCLYGTLNPKTDREGNFWP